MAHHPVVGTPMGEADFTPQVRNAGDSSHADPALIRPVSVTAAVPVASPALQHPSPAQLPGAAAAEQVGGRGAREAPSTAAAEVTELAARALPAAYYQTGAARARQEVFMRRATLTHELTALGLPPVYEHQTGVHVGKQVSTATELTAGGDRRNQDQRPWRRLREQKLNPAHNLVMARNIRQKALLAQHGASAAVAGPGKASSRVLRYEAALDEASRTIAKLRVVSGADAKRMGSAPLSKPHYPHRHRDAVPSNETEGGDLMPGKLSRLVALQKAEEDSRAARSAQHKISTAERRRQEQIRQLAEAIVAAPQMGIRELGVYLPHELAADAGLHPEASSSPSEASASVKLGHSHTAELAEALQHLDIASAAARATARAVEDRYGARTFQGFVPIAHGGSFADDGGGGSSGRGISPVASSLGSGGHYLDEEGMADDDAAVAATAAAQQGSAAAPAPATGELTPAVLQGAATGSDASAGTAAPRPSGYPFEVMVDKNAAAGLEVIRYPSGRASRRQRAADCRTDARNLMLPVYESGASPATATCPEAVRQPSAQLANEVAGGKLRHHRSSARLASQSTPAATTPAGQSIDAPPGPMPQRPIGDAASQQDPIRAAPADAAAGQPAQATRQEPVPMPVSLLRVPNEIPHAGRIRLERQPEGSGMDVSGRWASTGRAATTGGRRSSGRTTNMQLPPAWLRQSHAERSASALAAADAGDEGSADTGGAGGSGAAGAVPRQRHAAKAGQMRHPHAQGKAERQASASAAGAFAGATTPSDGRLSVAHVHNRRRNVIGESDDDGPSLERFGVFSDDELNSPRPVDDSSSGDDDPWGGHDADALGYPKGIAQQQAAATPSMDVAETADAKAHFTSSDGESSNGSWGIEQGVALEQGVEGRNIQQQHAVRSRPYLIESSKPPQLRAREQPNIPPIDFMPPPAWLVAPCSWYQGKDGQEAATAKPSTSFAEIASSSTGAAGRPRPMGRVEAALARAHASPGYGVMHDATTFYFTEPRMPAS